MKFYKTKKFLSIIMFLFNINILKADIVNDVIYFHCYEELENLQVGITSFNGSLAEENLENNYEQIFKKYGFFNLSKLYSINDKNEVSTKKFEQICKIRTNTYKVIIEPYVLVDRFVSISLTLYKNDELLIDNLLFAYYRDSNIISGIDINNDDGYFTIIANGDFLTKNLFFFHDTNSFPIDNTNIKK